MQAVMAHLGLLLKTVFFLGYAEYKIKFIHIWFKKKNHCIFVQVEFSIC